MACSLSLNTRLCIAGEVVQKVENSLQRGHTPVSYQPMSMFLHGKIGVKMTDGSVITSASKLRRLAAASRDSLQTSAARIIAEEQGSPVNPPLAAQRLNCPPAPKVMPKLRGGEAGLEMTPDTVVQDDGVAQLASERHTEAKEGLARRDTRARVRFAPECDNGVHGLVRALFPPHRIPAVDCCQES